MLKKAVLGKIAHNICSLDSKQAYVLLWILWVFMAPNICMVFVERKHFWGATETLLQTLWILQNHFKLLLMYFHFSLQHRLNFWPLFSHMKLMMVNMWSSVVSHLSCHASLALWQELYQLSWLLSEIFGLHVPLNFTSSRHFEWLKESQKWSIWHFLFSLKFFLCTVVVSMNKVMPMIIFVSMASVIFDVIIFRPSENS